MKPFVQMPLETYDVLKYNNEYLKRKLKEEQELHNEDIAQINEVINDLRLKIDLYKQLILKCNCKYINIDVYSLEQYLDIDSWTYGMNYKDELLSIGITKQEMDEFIANKYEEYLKEKEESTDD